MTKPFTDRERFVQALSIFTVAPEAKARSTEERSDILDYIRNRYCKSITNDDWAAISAELNKNKEWILDACTEYKKTNPEFDNAEEEEEEEEEEEGFPEFDDDENDENVEFDLNAEPEVPEVEVVEKPKPIPAKTEKALEVVELDDDEPPKKTKTLRGLISKKK